MRLEDKELVGNPHELFADILERKKRFNYKPKKNCVFTFKTEDLFNMLKHSHQGTLYVLLPCVMIEIDGDVVNDIKSYVQLSESRDFYYLKCYFDAHKHLEVHHVKMVIVSKRRTNYHHSKHHSNHHSS
jgi:hypothetical protein